MMNSVHDKKSGDTFPADFADFFRRFAQIFKIKFEKSAEICGKNLRNLREKYLHLFCHVLRMMNPTKFIIHHPSFFQGDDFPCGGFKNI
jgi:hypothetical protein